MANQTEIYFDSTDPNNVGWAWRSPTGSGAIDGAQALRYLECMRDGVQVYPGDLGCLLCEIGATRRVVVTLAEGQEPVEIPGDPDAWAMDDGG